MRFPGQRKSKHYFPVNRKSLNVESEHSVKFDKNTYIVGIDQIIVDICASVPRELLEKYYLSLGSSVILDDQTTQKLYAELIDSGYIESEFAGGTIGNTLHNYSILSDEKSVLFGVMNRNIQVGNYAYKYLCATSSKVDLSYLQPVDGEIGSCFTLITEEGERTFAISKGKMNDLDSSCIKEDLIKNSAALVLTAYLLREDNTPILDATYQAIQYAKKYNVPIILTLGTAKVVLENLSFWQEFVQEHVTMVAMNEDEAIALSGQKDVLSACQEVLKWCDLILCTAGRKGLYMAGWTDDSQKRITDHPLLQGKIADFNQYEYSRPMKKSDCHHPIPVYSYIEPFLGGPENIKNTNGAGDGALSAILHDISANIYHRLNVPNSKKHKLNYLTYSSFSQLCKYANRVSYEVLINSNPRLTRGLPEKEISLEEAYWDR